MRQLGVGLGLYTNDQTGDWNDAPDHATAVKVLGSAPSCDALDFWRVDCAESLPSPMVGSYGYFPGLHGREEWREYHDLAGDRATLLASIFHAPEKPRRFSGNVPPYRENPLDYPKPSIILRIKLDLSAGVVRLPKAPNMMTWDSVFLEN